jgi:hydrogenase expression/formation protein HypC
MCLGVPGKIVRWIEREGVLALAEVEFAGIRRACHMACVTEAEVDDYVVVHAGVAISRIDADEAKRIFDELEQVDEVAWRNAHETKANSSVSP